MTGFADDPCHAEDLHAWHMLRPLLDAGGYLPWSTGAMRAAGLVVVCNEIVHGARTRVVECGSGASTVLLARVVLGERLSAVQMAGIVCALAAVLIIVGSTG